MLPRFLSTVAAAAALTLAPLVAQGPELLGLTRGTPLLIRQDPATCNVRRCQPPIGNPASVFAGGVAHDPTDRATWVTDGFRLVKVDSRDQCTVVCPPIAIPNLIGNEFATGLAYNERRSLLFVTLSNNVIYTFRVAGGCTPVLTNRCQVAVPTGFVLTGAATDDVNGRIFYSASPRVGSTVSGPIVYEAPQSDPCNATCRYRIDDCSGNALRQITGLGYDPCRGVLWSTDSRQSVASRLGANCTATPVACCRLPIASEELVGLCVLPATETSSGRSCTSNACPSCPIMRHRLTGDPSIGNPAFSLDLDNAPANSNAWLLFNNGPCTNTGPSFFFCGDILVPLTPLVVGPFTTGGSVSCTGSASLPLAIPADVALCGQQFATQWIGICPTGGPLSNFVSNCLSWTISGS